MPCGAKTRARAWCRRHGAVGAQAFATTAKNAGIKATPHILRHTAATWAMQNGGDPWQVSGYLGMTVETLIKVYKTSNRGRGRPLRHHRVGRAGPPRSVLGQKG